MKKAFVFIVIAILVVIGIYLFLPKKKNIGSQFTLDATFSRSGLVTNEALWDTPCDYELIAARLGYKVNMVKERKTNEAPISYAVLYTEKLERDKTFKNPYSLLSTQLYTNFRNFEDDRFKRVWVEIDDPSSQEHEVSFTCFDGRLAAYTLPYFKGKRALDIKNGIIGLSEKQYSQTISSGDARSLFLISYKIKNQLVSTHEITEPGAEIELLASFYNPELLNYIIKNKMPYGF